MGGKGAGTLNIIVDSDEDDMNISIEHKDLAINNGASMDQRFN